MVIKGGQIFDCEVIGHINKILLSKGYEVREGETLDPYTDYYVYQGKVQIFRTIFPSELIVKIAQLLPESEVRIYGEIGTTSENSLEITIP